MLKSPKVVNAHHRHHLQAVEDVVVVEEAPKEAAVAVEEAAVKVVKTLMPLILVNLLLLNGNTVASNPGLIQSATCAPRSVKINCTK